MTRPARRITRLAALLSAGLLLVSALPAGANDLRVLASFLPMYLFARNVAGETPGVSVDLMLPASLGCPHEYALTPGDMRKIASANLFIANGYGMEEFLGAPVRKANPGIRIVESAEGVSPIRTGVADHGGINPHTWVSPRNAILQVRNIERAMSAASPRNAPAFRRNADAYVAKLAVLAGEFEAASSRFRNRNIVTFHNVFDYLARDLGLNIVGEIEDTPGQEPSAGEIRKLIRTIREKKAAAVFWEPQYPDRLARMIADEAGVPSKALDPVSTGSESPSAYESVMRQNLRTLSEALGMR
ncbi:MAG: metal ABC transporter substrate-binding protein [Deltaproteobacteria bacterium]|nr:metal ABC transporter substrate-binding protein [Candidatus Deferrimicrobiaceae bacterium]